MIGDAEIITWYMYCIDYSCMKISYIILLTKLTIVWLGDMWSIYRDESNTGYYQREKSKGAWCKVKSPYQFTELIYFNFICSYRQVILHINKHDFNFNQVHWRNFIKMQFIISCGLWNTKALYLCIFCLAYCLPAF